MARYFALLDRVQYKVLKKELTASLCIRGYKIGCCSGGGQSRFNPRIYSIDKQIEIVTRQDGGRSSRLPKNYLI